MATRPAVREAPFRSIADRLSADRQRFDEKAGASERLLSPDQLYARVEARFPEFGITRAGRLTGLDRIGIPVWMATRPNAANLSVSQGKGRTDALAKLSAVLESVEMAIAERPLAGTVVLSSGEAIAAGHAIIDTRRSLRAGCSLDPLARSSWVEGLDLLGGKTVLVPEEMVTLRDLPGLTFWQSSDGLGAGACLLEAANHGLCELIERDAMGLWSFRSPPAVLAAEVAPHRIDESVADLARQIEAAQLRLRLFDITTDLDVPAFLATIAPVHPPSGSWRHLDLASGTGAHRSPARAASQAIMEAAQTRITTIAGARDDLAPDAYAEELSPDLRLYVDDASSIPCDHANPAAPDALSGPMLLDHLCGRLAARGVRSAVLVPLTDDDEGVNVARMIVPDLEQDPRTKNRRLGRRAIAAMMGRR